jgi:hypothetical protein
VLAFCAFTPPSSSSLKPFPLDAHPAKMLKIALMKMPAAIVIVRMRIGYPRSNDRTGFNSTNLAFSCRGLAMSTRKSDYRPCWCTA